MKHSKQILILLTATLMGACGDKSVTEPVEDPIYSAATEEAAALISADGLRRYTAEISADSFEGRGPGSKGDALAREYLAEKMAAIGFQPGAADGGWEQPIEFIGLTPTPPPTWDFISGDETLSFRTWDDFIAGSGVQADKAVVEDAEVVFVGYGIEAPEYNWNDYKGYDLKGKVLLMLNNDPDWDPALFAGKTRLFYGRWDYKYASAAAQGAAGAIIIHTRASAGYPFQVVQTSWTGESFELPTRGEERIQVASWLTEDAARKLVSFAGRDLDKLIESAHTREFEPVSLGVTTSIAMDVAKRSVQSANVLGLLPGSDPDLKDEVVIYSAHHDHLGISKPDATGDVIYNGALDNGTGMAQLLEIGNALASLPVKPRRSILLAFVAGEEQGLLGSEYYAQYPTFAPGKIAANINFDGGNIWGKTSDITFVGLGKSSTDDVVKSVAARQGRVVKPDQYPDRGYFYRSDQFNFAKIGVPAIYFDSGVDFLVPFEGELSPVEIYENNNYHQPSDEIEDSWDFAGMVEDALVGFWSGLTIANTDEMPTWNKGDEFEAARLAALEAVK